MSLEVTGKLLVKFDTQQVSEKFKKREFVLELAEEINGNTYTNFAKMQLVQNKCEIIDRFKEGDLVKVSFNIKGNKWERDGNVNYITNLDACRIESTGAAQPTGQTPLGNNYAIPVHASNHTTNGGNGIATPQQVEDYKKYLETVKTFGDTQQIDDLSF